VALTRRRGSRRRQGIRLSSVRWTVGALTIHLGDCVSVMAAMPPDSIDAIVCDPPYGLEFMGKEWDRLDGAGFHAPKDEGRTFSNASGHMFDNLKALPRYGSPTNMQQWHEQWATAALRVAKPGAYLLAFGGTRTVHRMTVALEDAGWIIRDMLVWAYACLSDDTEILTREGWVRYNRANVGQWIAAFDPGSGAVRWEQARAVHVYDHEGTMAEVGPQVVTLNHRVVIDPETARVPRLSGMWDDIHEARSMVAEGSVAGLLEGVQREAAHPRSEVCTGTGMVSGAPTTLVGEDDRSAEPRLEGRRYRVQEAWQLLGRPVRASTGVGATDGTSGRVRHGTPAGDGAGVRVPADQDRMREPREPRPDRQRADEPDALAGQPDAQAVRVGQVSTWHGEPDTLRLVSGYVGKVWCVTVPSGAFVARRNGVVFVTGNSGFPKSRALLKPAWEPIVMARKPGPLRDLDIEGCRIGTDAGWSYPNGAGGNTFHGQDRLPMPVASSGGRWPANVVLTDPIFDGGWDGVVGGGGWYESTAPAVLRRGATTGRSIGFGSTADLEEAVVGYGDTGTYSRFFLIPKASRSDREPVMPGMLPEVVMDIAGQNTPQGRAGRGVNPVVPTRRNAHPTVKPIELMRHLVRLVTPAGGCVLDPFLGSGTTALAAEQEGRQWVGIEREAEYVRIAEARLSGWQRGLGLDVA
jgi:DNA modification methylase